MRTLAGGVFIVYFYSKYNEVIFKVEQTPNVSIIDTYAN